MKIAQLTDLHIGREGEETYGIDGRSNFLRCLEEIKSWQPDLLVVTGDLCFSRGDAEIYAWLAGHFQSLPFPFRAIGGNHDDVPLMVRTLGLSQLSQEGHLYGEEYLEEEALQLIYLDTASHCLSANQIRWLERVLDKRRADLRLLFMHHPPLLYSRSGFMDRKHALRNREEVLPVLKRQSVQVFCGHYHAEKALHQPPLSVFITPSTFLQIDLDKPDFTVDHYTPAWRKVETDSGLLKTEVRYVR